MSRLYLLILFLYLIVPTGIISVSAQSATNDTILISSLLQNADTSSSDSAVFFYQQAISIANEKLKSGPGSAFQKKLLRQLVKAHLGIGLVYYQKMDYTEALRHFNLALQPAKTLDDPAEIGECFFNFGEVYLEQSRYKEAMGKYQEALVLYKKAGDESGAFWSYLSMGIVQKQIGNFNDAVICYENALSTAQNAGLKNEEAFCYNNLGNVYRKKGDFSKAMEAYQKAINDFNTLKDELSSSDCMNNIGNLYLDNGDPFRALEYYNQSLRFVEVKQDDYRLIIRYKNLADAYTDLKDYDNAAQFLDDAIKLCNKADDKTMLGSCYAQFGKLQSAKGEYAISIAYHQKAASLFQQAGAKAEEAEALVDLAVVELEEGLVKDATTHALAAKDLSENTGALKTRFLAEKCLADCYEYTGDARQALHFLNHAMQLKDSIYTIEKYRTIEEIEAGFISNELKNENKALTQNSILQKQAIRTKNTMVVLLGICMIFGIALIWLIYKRQKEANRETSRIKQISEQKIEKLSEDLTVKERELTAKTVFITQKNQLLEQLIGELEQLKSADLSSASIYQLQMKLKQELSPNAWKEFELQFNEVHPGFQNRLLEKYPELTPTERRLCTFIRMDMNTREIASLTGHSIKSLEVARTRIRKKLGIPHEYNLTNHIALI
jgi:tetratricopeptide (TPR) repeat protein